MSLYDVEYDPRTEAELKRLPVRIRRAIDRKLEYLRASPFRSHPGVHVKPTAEVHGAWHFHVGKEVRVFYIGDGSVLWVVKVEHGVGVTTKVLRELRRRS